MESDTTDVFRFERHVPGDRRRHRLVGLAVALAALGCSASADEETAPETDRVLVAPADWVHGGTDPIPDHRPETVACEDAALSPEDIDGTITLEIDLALCNYMIATQPTAVDIPAGRSIEVSVAHYALVGPSGTMGHFAIALGDALIWERWVPIPADFEIFTETVTVDADVPAGTPVTLHVHNHGLNTWNLVGLTLKAPQ